MRPRPPPPGRRGPIIVVAPNRKVITMVLMKLSDKARRTLDAFARDGKAFRCTNAQAAELQAAVTEALGLLDEAAKLEATGLA